MRTRTRKNEGLDAGTSLLEWRKAKRQRASAALHVATAGALLEAGVDLRGAVVVPGPVPGDGLEVDAADDRARAHRVIRHLAHEVEGVATTS
jgi:hypothetical protein